MSSMAKDILIAADDFGLTRGITDTILETVDKGPVTLVSVIPNGESVAYAIEEFKKRSEHLALAVHLNLTEGKALSSPQEIPRLVDARGMFKHSVAGLWSTYALGTRAKRAALRAEVRAEMSAQCAVIRSALSTDAFAVNGHQHVHMIPFVFDELITLEEVSAVRIVREKFFLCGIPSPMNVLARFVLAALSPRAAERARARGIRTNDWFIGFLYAGRMNERIAKSGITNAGEGSIEVLFHPGSALHGELQEWQRSRADIQWHYALERSFEREALKKLYLNKQNLAPGTAYERF